MTTICPVTLKQCTEDCQIRGFFLQCAKEPQPQAGIDTKAKVAVERRAEVFSPTMQLRWNEGVLEQLWQGERGTQEWRPVPQAGE